MPRASGQKEYISLNKGLITEASPLAFPEGATSDEINFTINKNGLFRERRKGFQSIYEDYSTFIGDNCYLENLFYWRGSGYVIAIITTSTSETYLRLHSMDESFSTVLDVLIADQAVSTQIAELTNYLVITLSNHSKPIMLEYKEATEEISVSEITLHVRDFELVDDGLSVSDNPTTLDDDHNYNLLNAGLAVLRKDDTDASKTRRSPIVTYYNQYNSYPSNADVVSLGMITDEDGEYTFDPEYVRDAGLGNSLAPRGHYVYPIDDFDRDGKLVDPYEDGSPSTTLTPLGDIDLSGNPTYNPDEPDDPSNPDTPWDSYPDIPWWKYGPGL